MWLSGPRFTVLVTWQEGSFRVEHVLLAGGGLLALHAGALFFKVGEMDYFKAQDVEAQIVRPPFSIEAFLAAMHRGVRREFHPSVHAAFLVLVYAFRNKLPT